MRVGGDTVRPAVVQVVEIVDHIPKCGKCFCCLQVSDVLADKYSSPITQRDGVLHVAANCKYRRRHGRTAQRKRSITTRTAQNLFPAENNAGDRVIGMASNGT